MDAFDRSNLTRTQLALWLSQQLNPDTPLYHSALGVIIPAHIDRVAFNAAFQKFLDCSDIMRTAITIDGGAPMQRVQDHIDYTPEFYDFSAESDPLAAYKSWADKRCHTRFNFEVRLFDVVLVKLEEEKYVWYFCQHHIICDMFSFLIAIQYMAMLYEAALSGSLDAFEPFPSFQSYVEEETKQRGVLADPKQRAYWEEKFAQEPDPISFYGKPVPRLVGSIHRADVDMGEKISRQIRTMIENVSASSKSAPAAQFNIFAAITFAYLNRICDVRRPSLGMPFHNRRDDSRKQINGILMGVLPLTIEIEDRDSLNTLIAKIGAEVSANLRNSAYYIHNLAHTQGHDVLLNGLFIPAPQFAGVTCDFHWPDFQHVLDPLVLNFYENPNTGNFGNYFIVNGSIFDEEMRRLLVTDYKRMAHALLDNPDAPIRDIELLSDDDKQRLLVEWNATDAPFPDDKTIHQLVEAQAERTPDAIAVAYEGRTLTYRELNTRANQLAHHLKSVGVESEVLVGLCVDRSPEMVIGLLGILKSGGAYVPLDPAYPVDRLAFMLQDAEVHFVVTTESRRETLPTNGATVVSLDRDWDSIATREDKDPVNGVHPRNLAYVIYTSGSTGTPKGSMLEHRNVCNLIAHKTRKYGLAPGSRVLQFCSLNFDPSVLEIFVTLTNGSTLYLLPQEKVKSPNDVLQLMKDERINAALATPSLLRALPHADLPDLKIVESGGEVCSQDLVKRWAKGRRFFNAYGPTETTVCVSEAICEPDTVEAPPIGRPIANTRLYVLDERMRMVPPGVPGELYIGGAGVGRGYLNRPELTAQSFVPNPFNGASGDRLYKSGDRVRFREDGNIEFLGRIDHQVKVRGHRIELGEIESVLKQYPEIDQCVVDARQDATGDTKLVAYVVPKRAGQQFDGELKGYLRLLLPEYMLPAAYVTLDEIPLNTNGKIDRAALPKPERESQTHNELAAPRDAIELELQQIWEHVLDVSPVGVSDHFFDVGGHSLSAVHLMDQIQKHFDVRLSPASLFDAPTIELQAGLIRRAATSGPAPIVVPLRPTGTKTPFFCVHPAPGTVFCYMPIVAHLDPERPFYGVQAPTVDGIGRVIDSIPEAARIYVEAIRQVRPHGPYMLGGHSSGGNIAFEMAQQLRAQGEEVKLLVMLDSMSPIPGTRSEELYRVIVDVTNDSIWLASVVLLVEHFFATKLNISYAMLRTMPMDEQVQTVLDALKRINFVAPSADAGAIRGMVENFKRTLQSTMQYQSKVYDGKIAYLRTADLFTALPEGILQESLANLGKTLLRNWRMTLRVLPQMLRDNLTTIARSGAFRKIFSDESLGWKRFSTQPVAVYPIPGNHITMLADPQAKDVAATLAKCLDAADSSSWALPQ
ncbi:MAG: amino acid adenylation domain-containing protein [Candidatus Hydrogenedentes bacterium]|nr:amino acid adenylation domain-containing protein [Candidatus Hydrogenedentota bacterium]